MALTLKITLVCVFHQFHLMGTGFAWTEIRKCMYVCKQTNKLSGF
jgi:hypothetical protein